MRLEVESPETTLVVPEYPPAPPVAPPRRRRLDRFELSMLALFGAISLWVLLLDLFQVVAHGRVWTGTDGVYLVDQMQYLAWIHDAASHGLASNLFVVQSTPADYFQPAIMISGGIAALGVAPWLALLLWKPVAVIAAFFAVRAYMYRALDGRWPRRAALVIGLFFGAMTFSAGAVTAFGDLFLGFLSWGYTFGLLAVAAMAGALLSYDRARTANRLRWAPGVLGAIASLLHPWQGELLIILIIGGELMIELRRRQALTRRRLMQAGATILLTALPLFYYVVLTRVDLSWHLARGASKHSFPLLPVLLAIAPLAVAAIPAYRVRPRSFIGAATRFWPLAALVVFILSGTGFAATPLHAFQGISIPLAVLAVEGVQLVRWRRLRRPRLVAVLAVLAVTVPSLVVELNSARTLAAPTVDNANFITKDERDAIGYLTNDPRPGGVMTRSYLGAIIPGATGRHTYVGDCLWSEPQCYWRVGTTQELFDGTLGTAFSRKLVLGSGARFVLADCKTQADLERILGPVVRSVRHFGCAAVYTVQ
ncbi:MAG: hypothetical protein JOZ98_03095 [Solirubrobacterales bacterium]|nr:hypothetical protein [Solirubrobacterales bacterium]MBV9799871.1 hypothetical protein [Solirubrobacterales bacterium]